MIKYIGQFIMLALLNTAIIACSPIIHNHGYIPEQDDLDKLVVGIDTRESVQELLGSPISSGMLEDGSIFYIKTIIENKTYHEPKIIAREMLLVSFDKENTLSNLERLTIEDGRVIALNRRVTEPNIKSPQFLAQILGNIGNFDASDFFNQ